jgi:UTP:GlnB (protein PII) uridylyltransferase
VTHDELLDHVKHTVHAIEPDADIILYGSRARGDAHPESDWDFLILLDGVVDDVHTDAIRHRLYTTEWECGQVLSAIVRSLQKWNTPLYQVMPFSKVIRAQGMLL